MRYGRSDQNTNGNRPLGSVKASAESDKSSREAGRDTRSADGRRLSGRSATLKSWRIARTVASQFLSLYTLGFLAFFGAVVCTAEDSSATPRLEVVPMLFALFAGRSACKGANLLTYSTFLRFQFPSSSANFACFLHTSMSPDRSCSCQPLGPLRL